MHPVVFEGLFFLFLIIWVMIEVIVPAFRGKPLFPVWNYRGAERHVDEAEVEVNLAELERRAASRRREAELIRATKVKEETDGQ